MATQTAPSKPSKPASDGYSDMPLNTRQQNAVTVIQQWNPGEARYVKCVKTAITVISNVLYKPADAKYHKLRLSKPAVKKAIVDVEGGVKLLKLAGFQKKREENQEEILWIEPPSTVEELEQLTDIWLVLLKTQYLWGIHPDPNAPKHAALPKQFSIPNSLQSEMKRFFESNETAKSEQFQQFVRCSNDAKISPTALERYNHFAKAIKLLTAADANFFDLDNATHGLNDVDVSDIAALIVSEILSGYYEQDAAYTNLILAEDLRILAEKEKELTQQYQIENTAAAQSGGDTTDEVKKEEESAAEYKAGDRVLVEMKEEELAGTVRWVGQCNEWDDGWWVGVELDAENLIYGHNGYYNNQRFFGCAEKYGIYVHVDQVIKLLQHDDDDEKKPEDENGDAYKVVDIGCGWGNFGRLLKDKSLRPYLAEIEQESAVKHVDVYGFDISEAMLSIATQNEFEAFYKEMRVLDCRRQELKQFADGSVDVVVSCNCIMQDKQMGHPDETFLIEANRLLKDNGWFVVTRRFNGIHLGLQLYVYLMIAQQLGWKNVFASRIREVFYIGWQKMQNPNQK